MQASLSTSAKPVFLSYSNIDPGKYGFDLYTNGERKCLTAVNDLMEFSGYKAESHSKYLIGVRDGNSLLLKELVPMQVDGKLRVSSLGKRIQKSFESRNSLGEEFGSKKKKKEIKSKEINKVSSSSVLGMENIAVEIKESAPASVDLNLYSLLKPDASASKRELVYDLWEIFPKGDYDSLHVEYLMEKSMEELKKEFESLKLTAYVLSKLEIGIRGKNTRIFKIGLYIGFLMKFFRLKDKEIHIGLIGASPEIMDTFINKYTEYSIFNGNVRYRSSSQLKDKILASIGVLALHLDDFNTDINGLIQELGISITKMVKIYKELGIRIQVVKKSKMAVLALPLVFTSPKKY